MARKQSPQFKGLFPRSSALTTAPSTPILPAVVGSAEHPGFDEDDIKAALGLTRFNALMAAIVGGKPYSGAVFSCGHRTKNGIEVHCLYASDVELFLGNGG